MGDKKKKRNFISNVTVGGAALDVDSLKTLAENEPREFMDRCQKLIDEGELSWDRVPSVTRLFNALSDVQVTCTVNVMGQMREITASAFPLLAGGLVVAGVNEAYEGVPTIGQDLVKEVEDNKRDTSFASITSLDTQIDRVEEGQPFPEVLAGEERYTIGQKRNGRRISITAEMIEENNVSGIVQKVDALGEISGELVEEQTLSRVCDVDGSGASPAEPYVLHLNKTGTQLYNATVNNPGTRAPSATRLNTNTLVDTTDLENARVVLAAMLNTRGKRISIPISRTTLLVPDALVGVASKIRGSVLEPSVENENNNWGPQGMWQPRIVSSPKLDDFSTSAWYLGWFEKQFTRKWKLRFEYVTLEGNTQKFLETRIAFQARIAWDVEVGAVDYVYVVQNLTSSTAPS